MGKKLLLSLGVAGMLCCGTLGIVNAQSSSNGSVGVWNGGNQGNGLTSNIDGPQGIDTIGTDGDQEGGLVQVIKNFINWVLGILALIVLVIVLVGGFQMVTASGNEEKYKKGFTILKHAGIGLVIIGLAWFLVTIIFWLLRGTTGTAS